PRPGTGRGAGWPQVHVFHAGTAMADGVLVTAGGRVLGVQAMGTDVAGAIRTAYAAGERIRFAGAHYRRDIGHHALRRLGGGRPRSRPRSSAPTRAPPVPARRGAGRCDPSR